MGSENKSLFEFTTELRYYVPEVTFVGPTRRIPNPLRIPNQKESQKSERDYLISRWPFNFTFDSRYNSVNYYEAMLLSYPKNVCALVFLLSIFEHTVLAAADDTNFCHQIGELLRNQKLYIKK